MRPIVLHMPNNGAHLHLPCDTVKSKHKPRIRYANSSPALMENMRNTYDRPKETKDRIDWTAETKDRIDWTAHGQFLQQCFNQRSHFTKLVHNILPTNHRVHKYDKTRSANCSLRNHPDEEDRDHILRCPKQLANDGDRSSSMPSADNATK